MPSAMESIDDVELAIQSVARAPNGGLLVLPDSMNIAYRDRIIALAAQHGLPAVYFARLFVAAGGLMSYGTDLVDVFRQAASYFNGILRGASSERSSGPGANQVRNVGQLQNRQGPWPRGAAIAARARRRGDRIAVFAAMHWRYWH